jgi:L-lactate dehydrogenase
MKDQIDQGVRRAAYRIIDGKGATYYGIGAALARMSRCILYDERTVFTACSLVPEIEGVTDVALSLPLVIGRSGIQATLRPPISPDEKKALRHSALLMKQHAAGAGY